MTAQPNSGAAPENSCAPTYTFSIGAFAQTKQWPTKSFTWEDLKDLFSSHMESKKKDGLCFVAGIVLGSKRVAQAVERIDCLVYDIDGTDSLHDLTTKIEGLGISAIIYTTHSHRTTVTKLKTDKYDAWAKKNDARKTPDLNEIKRYLKDNKKGYLTNVQFDGSYKQDSETGFYYEVTHDPVDKMRLLIPLAQPIIMTELSHLTKEAIETYKAIYHGVGNALDIAFDHACSDPSRLHYLPSHPVGRDDFGTWIYEGKLLNYNDYPRALTQRTADTSRGKTNKDFVIQDRDNYVVDLIEWDRDHGADFDLEGVLKNNLPDSMIRGDRSNGEGYHIECPFEHEHTNPGGSGTFVVNGDGEKRWTIYCSHNSCLSAERTRIDYLRQLILDGFLSYKDMGYPFKQVEDADKVNAFKDAARGAGLDLSTLPELTASDLDDARRKAAEFADKTEALETGRALIKNARYTHELVTGYQTLLKNDVVIDLNELIALIAGSHASMKSIMAFSKATTDSIPLSTPEFIGEAKRMRNELVPLEKKLGNLLVDEISGSELDLEIKRLAEYYGLTETAVRDPFNIMCREFMIQRHDSQLIKRVEAFNERYALLHLGSKVFVMDVPTTIREGLPKLWRTGDAKVQFANQNVTIINDGKRGREVNVYDFWYKNYPARREVSGVTFDPSLPTEYRPGEKLNMWQGFPLRPIPGDTSIIDNHLLNIWCGGDEKVYNWLTYYLADIFQNPGRKPPAAIAILGKEGTGKSIIFEHGLSQMLGHAYGKTSERRDLVGNFNAKVASKLVVLAEEVLFAGNKQDMNLLKDKISSDTVRMERKHEDPIDLPNFTRFFFTSNHSHALHLGMTDRRMLVLRTTDDVLQNTEYFTKFRVWLHSGGREAWLHKLLNFKPEDYGLSEKDLYSPPLTNEKRSQIQQSIDPSHEFFYDLIKHGRLTTLPEDVDVPLKVSWALDEELIVHQTTFRLLFDAYVAYHAKSAGRFERTKYIGAFAEFFGGRLKDFSKKFRADKGYPEPHLMIATRRSIIQKCIGTGIMSEEDLEEAISNPESHLPLYDED